MPLGSFKTAIVDDYGLHSGQPAVGEQTSARGKEVVVVPPVDGFDHLNGHQLVEPAMQVAPVVTEHRDAVGHAGLGDPFLDIGALGLRDRRGRNAAAVARSCMDGEPAPARTDLDEVIVGSQVELGAEPVDLGHLRVVQARVGPLEQPAGVGHRVVEHHLEELVGHVVVRPDVALVVTSARRSQARRDVEHASDSPPEAVHPAEQRPHTTKQRSQQSSQVVDVPPAGDIGGAEAYRSRAQQRLIGAGIVDLHACHGIAGAQPMHPTGFDHLDRAAIAKSPSCEDDAPRSRFETGPDPARHGMAEQPARVHHGRALLSRTRKSGAARRLGAARSGQGQQPMEFEKTGGSTPPLRRPWSCLCAALRTEAEQVELVLGDLVALFFSHRLGSLAECPFQLR